MILIDPPDVPRHGRMWSHLASDTSYDELHVFAASARHPGCAASTATTTTCRPSSTTQVVAAGAVPVSSRELVARWSAPGCAAARTRRRRTTPG